MRHRIDDELCKIGMGDKRAGRVEDQDDPVFSRPLLLDEIIEGVELEIGGNDARHLAAQGRADRDHRCADTERQIRRRDHRSVGLHRLAIPAPVACVVSVFPQIQLSDRVALPILENASHRQFATGRGADQVDRNVGALRGT